MIQCKKQLKVLSYCNMMAVIFYVLKGEKYEFL